MRRKKREIRPLRPDPKYNNLVLAKFINYLMSSGKKTTARTVLYGALAKIEEAKKDPVEIFNLALRNITPRMQLRSKRVGGANYQVPREVSPERGMSLAMRWLIQAARSKKGSDMGARLFEEIRDASQEAGIAFKKKEEVHRMAEANKAFAHFAY